MSSSAIVCIEVENQHVSLCGLVRIRRHNDQVVQWCDLYIGRACYRGGWALPQSKWHNPFTVSKEGSIETACAKYYDYIKQSPILNDLEELRGKVLGCWCEIDYNRPLEERLNNPQCHGEVLMRLLLEKTFGIL